MQQQNSRPAAGIYKRHFDPAHRGKARPLTVGCVIIHPSLELLYALFLVVPSYEIFLSVSV
jgi:hypothetical protein